MANREFVLLAKSFRPEKDFVGEWFVSEKLDGMRAFWDGGVTRGHTSNKVPFANTKRDKEVKICTGLWSRYAKPIYAPDWFLDGLPNYPLDGELYLGPGLFQETISVVRTHTPDARWGNIKYCVFDLPSYGEWLKDGRINNPNYSETFFNYKNYFKNLLDKPPIYFPNFVESGTDWPSYLIKHEQVQLPFKKAQYLEVLDNMQNEVIRNKGEGLILRNPKAFWTPKRSKNLLKLKPWYDSEGVVIGWEPGEGKHEGRMGALKIKYKTKTLKIGTGFTDEERNLEKGWPVCFPLGCEISFKYSELSVDGIPLKASYYR